MLRGLAKTKANNARMKKERPSGRPQTDKAIDRYCSVCGGHFTSMFAFVDHAGACGAAANPNVPPSKPQMCPKCGIMCSSRNARGLHQMWCCAEGAD